MFRHFPLCDDIVEPFDTAKVSSYELVFLWYGVIFYFIEGDPEIMVKSCLNLASRAQFLIQFLVQFLIHLLCSCNTNWSALLCASSECAPCDCVICVRIAFCGWSLLIGVFLVVRLKIFFPGFFACT